MGRCSSWRRSPGSCSGVGAFTGLTSSPRGGAGALLARTATHALLIGAAIVAVEYSILGYEVKRIANAWQVASGVERQHLHAIAEALFSVSGGLFVSFISSLLGLPFALMGFALAVDRTYPRAMGWIAIVGGSGALIGGALRFLRIGLVPIPALYGAFIVPLTLWLAAMGLLMWRRGVSLTAFTPAPARNAERSPPVADRPAGRRFIGPAAAPDWRNPNCKECSHA
jgi:hypothetical protein